VHASAAVVACVAVADVGALLDVTIDVASGETLGVAAVVPAHPATRTERRVAAMSRIAHIIAESRGLRGKTSLKT
jgi:hypothetical protein